MRKTPFTCWMITAGLLVATAGCRGTASEDSEKSEMAPPPAPPAASASAGANNTITLVSFEEIKEMDGVGQVDSDAPTEFTQTDSGLKYRILRKSDGRKPVASDSVVAHYRGWLDNGNEFDSSYKRGQPTPFPLSGVIPGWTEGLQLIGQGGMIELEIPSELGYGARGAGADIPPNSRLHFIVELVKVQ